jgi:hypothetical protein
MRGAGGPVEHVRYCDIKMTDVTNAIVFQLDYVDDNRPDFRGDPTKVPSIRDILIERVIINNSTNAGRIIGLPDSPITRITFRDVQLTAKNDFRIKDADHIVFENVTGH